MSEQAAYPVVAKLLKSLEAFQEYVPLLVHLRNPGIRVRHWNTLSAALNTELGPGIIVTSFVLFLPHHHFYYRCRKHSQWFYSNGVYEKAQRDCWYPTSPHVIIYLF